MTIGEKIRQLRDLKGYSQESLAEDAGISATYLGQIERNEVSPKWEKIEQVARALQIDPVQLVSFDSQSVFVQNSQQANIGSMNTNHFNILADKEREHYEARIASLEREIASQAEIIRLLKK